MSENSKIEWTDATWNPSARVLKVSPWVQALLRRDVCGAFCVNGASFRQGI